VGKTSHVISLNGNGKNGFLAQAELEKLHRIWEEELARPHPAEAIDIISQCNLVTAISKASD
jgi:hypothetical protein